MVEMFVGRVDGSKGIIANLRMEFVLIPGTSASGADNRTTPNRALPYRSSIFISCFVKVFSWFLAIV